MQDKHVNLERGIEAAANYGKYAHLMPLGYAILCYAMLYFTKSSS